MSCEHLAQLEEQVQVQHCTAAHATHVPCSQSSPGWPPALGSSCRWNQAECCLWKRQACRFSSRAACKGFPGAEVHAAAVGGSAAFRSHLPTACTAMCHAVPALRCSGRLQSNHLVQGTLAHSPCLPPAHQVLLVRARLVVEDEEQRLGIQLLVERGRVKDGGALHAQGGPHERVGV